MKAIALKKIFFSYDHTAIIKDVTLSIEMGEFSGIIGPNGAGKSTLLRIMANVLKNYTGSISIMEKDIRETRRKELARTIGFIPQETYFQHNYIVEDVVAMGRYPYLEPFQHMSEEDTTAIEWAIEKAGIKELKKRSINSLSSGERQMVVIGRALAQKPKILLLDEPTSHLDIQHQSEIMELLKILNQQEMTIVIVNHDLNLASMYCKKLILLQNGMVYSTGTPQEIINERTIAEVYKTETRIVLHPEKKVPQILLK
jgi:iron complex transport system ATP-binding protein